MDNAVLWLLYSLGKGTPEVVGQANRGLKALLGCSLDTLKAATRRLAGNGLVMARSDGFTLLAPTAEASAWWQGRTDVSRQPCFWRGAASPSLMRQ